VTAMSVLPVAPGGPLVGSLVFASVHGPISAAAACLAAGMSVPLPDDAALDVVPPESDAEDDESLEPHPAAAMATTKADVSAYARTALISLLRSRARIRARQNYPV
jgi:hypothetical protein